MSVELLAFTDPVCTWCWGSEPVLRKLETWYVDAVFIRYVMGGLVEDITAFYDSANDIGGDPEKSNLQIARHWLEATARHGMPVRTEGFRLFSAETISTYPQNVAFKAAELTNRGWLLGTSDGFVRLCCRGARNRSLRGVDRDGERGRA
jgi:protein-disulfide isomerase-like protein with CxxC motif